jgi:hypothetical protein
MYPRMHSGDEVREAAGLKCCSEMRTPWNPICSATTLPLHERPATGRQVRLGSPSLKSSSHLSCWYTVRI